MKTRFSVGRDLNADIPIADASVSRRHAELSPVDGGRLFVTDCKSSNGTFLVRDGAVRPLAQETVLSTDQLKFGEVTIGVPALLDAIRLKSKPEPEISLPPSNARLVRCDCGAVKLQSGRCPACGEAG